ncbi:MAG: hypothetical protein DMG77_15145 [Acidobacteria bacterium]|nr:MAG: hypothetical protein DMG77_15145 [Acidobacteriota bacterium]
MDDIVVDAKTVWQSRDKQDAPYSLPAINRQSSQISPSKRLPRSGGTAPHTRQTQPSDSHRFAHASSFLRSVSSLLTAAQVYSGYG